MSINHQNMNIAANYGQQTYSRLNQMANAIQSGNMLQAIASMFGR